MPTPILNRYLVRLGGISAIIAAFFFLGTIIYTLAVLAPTGYLDIMEDQSQIPKWVSAHKEEYSYLWLLFFLSQLFLLPLPFAIEENFRIESPAAASWLRMGALLGVVSIVMTMISIIVYYAASPVIASAWEQAGSDTTEQWDVIHINDIIASIGTMTRVFAEFLLGIWLLVVGVIIMHNPVARITRWTVILTAIFTLITTATKVFDRSTPLEIAAPFFLAASWILLGKTLIADSCRSYPSISVMSPGSLQSVVEETRREQQ